MGLPEKTNRLTGSISVNTRLKKSHFCPKSIKITLLYARFSTARCMTLSSKSMLIGAQLIKENEDKSKFVQTY